VATRKGSSVRSSLLGLALASGLWAQTDRADLQDLLAEALNNNPEIVAAQKRYEASRQRPTQVSSLPDPMMSPSYNSSGRPWPGAGLGTEVTSNIGLMVSQEIPFPGKLSLQGQIASAEADAELWRYEEVRREAVAEMKTAYYDLFLAEKLTEVVEKSKALLQQFVEISESVYKVGKGAQQDVLKAQVEVSRLLDRLTVLRSERESAQVRINTLLYRPPDTPVEVPSEISRPKLACTLDQLYQKAEENNPRVRMNRKEIERDEYGVALAKKSFYPDFEAQFSYFNRTDLPEMYGLMFKAKVPLYFWRKQRPELESATSSLMEQRRLYESTLSNLYFKLKDPFLKATTDANLLELYGNAIVPQSTLALESSISSYRVGTVDFLSLLSNWQTVLEYEMKYYEVLADNYRAFVTLESLTGEKLTP